MRVFSLDWSNLSGTQSYMYLPGSLPRALGHSSVAVTSIYLHSSDHNHRLNANVERNVSSQCHPRFQDSSNDKFHTYMIHVVTNEIILLLLLKIIIIIILGVTAGKSKSLFI